jgi:predicted Holliday junction resolvase-like endonuclease
MTTELIIEHIRNSWWILLFIICMTSYFIYSFIKETAELKAVKDKKKALEGELSDLEVQYDEQAKKLEEKVKERERLNKGGKK